MTLSQKIALCIAYKNTSQSAVASSIGMTRSNFGQKFKRATFTETELEQIAEALGATHVQYFEFPDGTKF